MAKTVYKYDFFDWLNKDCYLQSEDYMADMIALYPDDFTTANNTSYTEYLINKVVMPRIGYHSAITLSEETTDIASEVKSKELASQIDSFLSRTRDSYEERLSLWTSKKASLMDQLGTVSKSVDNDAPQSADPDADSHASFINKTTTATDMATVASRLNEIDNTIRDIYSEWEEDFSELFGTEEGNELEDYSEDE